MADINDVPMSVLIQGPAAVAAWLARRDIETVMGVSLDASRRMLDIADRLGLRHNPALTPDQFHASITALITLSAILAFAGKDGMRGPARDAVSEILDEAFNTIDRVADSDSDIATLIRELRGKKR